MNPLLVADSFLVADGTVRGLELHRRRFTTSCTALGVSTAGDFWDESLERLPREGRWFPRFELLVAGESSVGKSGAGERRIAAVGDDGRYSLALQIRPAPSVADPSVGCRVVLHDGPDPRSEPRVKGPDLAVLGELKARAAAVYGADEVVLVDDDGAVLEAAYSAVLWWEDDTLCFPPADRPILPSVTAQLIRRLAAVRGVEVAERARTAADLTHRPTWLANALHGIRPITSWPPSPPHRLAAPDVVSWQSALTALARPL